MRPIYLIHNHKETAHKHNGLESGLFVNEFFTNTIQGEGASVGMPATFLRLQGCTLNCSWCDTEWQYGAFYTYNQLFALMETYNVIRSLMDGQHLVITGGSPLKQQKSLFEFLTAFKSKYSFLPYIEIENECVLYPDDEFSFLVDQWNNSPKLETSGMKTKSRYKPNLIKAMSGLKNSWFKFVVGCEDDWKEIYHFYIQTRLISKKQVILMPLASTYEELIRNRNLVVEIAIKNNVRYSTREQLIIKRP